MDEQKCHVDLFEFNGLAGRQHRIAGPGAYTSLRSVDGGWGIHFESMTASASAHVRIYASAAPDETLSWLLPGQILESIASAPSLARFDSFEILCEPPGQDRIGFDLFVLVKGMARGRGNGRRN